MFLGSGFSATGFLTAGFLAAGFLAAAGFFRRRRSLRLLLAAGFLAAAGFFAGLLAEQRLLGSRLLGSGELGIFFKLGAFLGLLGDLAEDFFAFLSVFLNS